MDSEKSLPPFATGRIAGDYSILFEYWRIAREKGREDLVEKALLVEEDYAMLREEAQSYPKLGDLLDRITGLMEERIDPDIAVEAVKRTTGAQVDSQTARRLVARLLASWLLEAGEHWRMIRFREG